MKITMYELLGLVKDGKAPSNIKYRQNIFEFIHSLDDYKPDDIKKYHGNYLFHYLFEEEINFLNDEVEIIEEPKKIDNSMPKHLSNEFIQQIDKCITHQDIKCIAHKVNEVINYLQHISK